MRIKDQQNFWSGILFTGFGITALVVARDYPMGEALRMGPGFFPIYVGIILTILGGIITVMGLRLEGERVGSFTNLWRPLILMSLAFAVFAWSIDRIGFVPALALLVVLGSFAGQDFKLKEIIIETIVLTVICIGIFVYGLRLALPLFWWN